MKYKKSLVVICLIISLFSIASVAASDANGTVLANENQIIVDNDETLAVEEQDVDEISETGNDELHASTGTFTDLANDIESAGDELNLTRNYIYSEGDSDYMDGIEISKPLTILGNGFIIDCNHQSRAFMINQDNVVLKNISFINGNHDYGGAIQGYGKNVEIFNCSFKNCTTEGEGGAINCEDGFNLINCSFTDCYAKDRGGAMNLGNAINCTFIGNSAGRGGGAISTGSAINCTFINNSADYAGAFQEGPCENCIFINNSATRYGGAISEGRLVKCIFINNTAKTGGAIFNGRCQDCIFINNSATESGGAIEEGNIKNSIFINNSAEYGGAISEASCDNCSFINNSATNQGGAVYYGSAQNSNFTNNTAKIGGAGYALSSYNCNFTYNDATEKGGAIYMEDYDEVSDSLFIDNYAPQASAIFWNSDEGNLINCTFISNIDYSSEEVIYWYGLKGNLLDSTFINNINSTQIIWNNDKGTIKGCKFLNTTTNNVVNDGATFIKRSIDFKFNTSSFDYKNPKPTTIELINVLDDLPIKATSIIVLVNDNRFKVDLNNYSATVCDELIDLNVGTWNITAIFEGDDNYYYHNATATVTVLPTATATFTVEDVNGTVDHEVKLVATVSYEDRIINDGVVVFFDGSTQIGEADVHDGSAILNYTPTVAGDHSITGFLYSANYGNLIDSGLLHVEKGKVDLKIDDILSAYFTNPSNFVVNVTSNFKGINEGKIKFYVNNTLICSNNVYDGIASLTHVLNSTGLFNLSVVYDETENYFANGASALFSVNKMPTTLSGESVIFDEESYKTFTTELKDNNNNGVYGQQVEIEVIKYSGESSKKIKGITNADGIIIYDVGNLAGGMWYVTGTYAGNANYIDSRFVDKFIVVRMNTTTTIEEITHPKVNHSYKLKANIHDESGKLVKEGIVQFYLDGVDIGSIDLSKNNGHQNPLGNDLLGAVNPIFSHVLGEEDPTDLYIEYTPTRIGNHTLLAIYEGTSIYKSSNQTITFTVGEGPQPIDDKDIIIPTLPSSSTESVIVKLPNDATGTITLSIAGKEYKFDVLNGVANVKVPELGNGAYPYTITYSGDGNYSSFVKTGSLTVNKASPTTKPISKPVIKTTLTLKKVKVKRSAKKLTVQATLKVNGKGVKNKVIKFKFNKKTYKARTNTKGVAKITVNKKVLKKLKKGKKVTYTASYGKITKKVIVKVK